MKMKMMQVRYHALNLFSSFPFSFFFFFTFSASVVALLLFIVEIDESEVIERVKVMDL